MKTLDTECRISNQTERARPKIIAIGTIHNKFFNWICKKRERKKKFSTRDSSYYHRTNPSNRSIEHIFPSCSIAYLISFRFFAISFRQEKERKRKREKKKTRNAYYFFLFSSFFQRRIKGANPLEGNIPIERTPPEKFVVAARQWGVRTVYK